MPRKQSRAAQDTTLINNRTTRKQIADLTARVKRLESVVRTLQTLVIAR